MDKNGVIYRMKCNECNKEYIVETGKKTKETNN